MKRIVFFLLGLTSFLATAQMKVLDSVQTDNWMVKDFVSPKMIFETIVYQDSISVKLVKGNSKAMDKLIGTPKFSRVFVGKVVVTETEFTLKAQDSRVTVTRGGIAIYTIVEEKDDFTGEITKNTYFGKRPN